MWSVLEPKLVVTSVVHDFKLFFLLIHLVIYLQINREKVIYVSILNNAIFT